MGGMLTEEKKDERVHQYNLGELNLHTVNVIEKDRIVEVPKFNDVEVDRVIYVDKKVEVPIFKDVEVKRCVVKDEDITPIVEQAVKKMLAKFEAKLDKACSDLFLLLPKVETAIKKNAEQAAKDIVNGVTIKIEADTKLNVA